MQINKDASQTMIRSSRKWPVPYVSVNLAIKRAFDIAASALALILLAPIMLAIALLIRLTLGSPVLFVQARPGMNAEIFHLYKFRTMRHLVDEQGMEAPDHERLTRTGRFLRTTSLDELPQLWNVLTGDMSIVGPRPLLVRYLPLYSAVQARRHEVRPGMTGWAQIHGRRSLDSNWEEKFRLDVWYVDNQSFLLDMKILARTALKVLRRDDISQSGQATSEAFKGTGKDR